jgi:hypothetical protein
MSGRPAHEQTRYMTFPTVVEITPRLEAVTPDTFIVGLTAPPREALDRAATADPKRP